MKTVQQEEYKEYNGNNNRSYIHSHERLRHWYCPGERPGSAGCGITHIPLQSGKKNIKEVNTHTIHYGYIYDKEELIDEVLVMVMPVSYTHLDVYKRQVVRHRVTRLIRESYRLNEMDFDKGLDIVVVARPSAKEKNFQEIESALLHLKDKLHIAGKNNDEKISD